MPEEPQPAGAIEVFYSYSHKDEELRDALDEHLSTLKRQLIIRGWHDRVIGPGREWAGEIDEHLRTADVILLLVSSSFISSDYCYDVELRLAMQRHVAKEARVIPIILRTCDWADTPFGKLQALPKNALPVTAWLDRDEALTDVAKGIRTAAAELLASRRASDTTAAETPEGARVTVAEKVQAGGAKKVPTSLMPRPPIVGFVTRRDDQGRVIVGRVREELAPDKRQIVALWGPGGSGKTTLAAEVMRTTEDVFHGRIAWASSLRSADFNLVTLLDEIATQLGYDDLRKLAPESKAAQVGALTRARPTLVVLDNFETINEEEREFCLDFLSQIAACPVLITTRSYINRDDVLNVPLAAMSMEEAHALLGRLAERTRTPSAFDRLDRDDLIRRCEANPLVLQWAVRHVDLATRPQDVLSDLARGAGDVAERVFTRSFNLPQVGDDGRNAILALSLFTPSASREALAEVSGFGKDLRRLGRAVEGLSALWLVEATDGSERLFLRGLTRELAKSQLLKDTRADVFRQRFVLHFLRHAEAHEQPTPEDLDALEVEKNNVLGAIDAAFEMQNWEAVMRICGALENLLFLHGYWDEAISNGQQGVVAARELKNDLRAARFTGNVATIRTFRGEYEGARQVYREALDTFRRLESDNNVAVCLHQLGLIAQAHGDLEEARQLYGESLEIKKRLGNQRGVAYTLHQLGRVAHIEGDPEGARRLYEDSLEINRRLDIQEGIASNLHQLAELAEEVGETKEARRLYDESLEIKQKLGKQHGVALSLYNLGMLAEKEGDKMEAAQLLRRALLTFEKLGSFEAENVRKDLARVESESS